jgi:DNA-binding NarL/FixJ family response regulator
MTPATAPAAEPLRVVVVDDHEIVVAGLTAMLAPFTDRVRIVGSAHGVDEALDVIGFQALRAGAAGYLLKRIRGEELVSQLELAAGGTTVIDATMAGRVVTSAARLERDEFWPGAHLGLSHRESEVLALIVAGCTNRAIAARLVVGDETVKTHVRAVLRKLDVPDRTAAVAKALREGVFQ